ncbi:hypothetical protein CLOM_g9144 [Closterium sp. NIES-68]|nr:hypothetical protein CLOM_g3773 [Closterium sp. NIES-68]GJP49987.1 hypothetical protein CLOM_g9144 [Closterium sp. NIES-68]
MASVPGGAVEGNPSGMRALVARFQESYRNAIAQQRPWSELTDRSLFARPDNLNDALGRLRKNTSYFQANYLSILIVVIVLCMLWNPTAILWLALLAAAWIYIFMARTDALIIAGRTLNEREKFLAMAVISIVIVFGLTSVGSILMSGLVMGAAAIALHAAFRVPDDLFLDDNESGSFLSFLGGRSTVPIPTAI